MMRQKRNHLAIQPIPFSPFPLTIHRTCASICEGEKLFQPAQIGFCIGQHYLCNYYISLFFFFCRVGTNVLYICFTSPLFLQHRCFQADLSGLSDFSHQFSKTFSHLCQHWPHIALDVPELSEFLMFNMKVPRLKLWDILDNVFGQLWSSSHTARAMRDFMWEAAFEYIKR